MIIIISNCDLFGQTFKKETDIIILFWLTYLHNTSCAKLKQVEQVTRLSLKLKATDQAAVFELGEGICTFG